MALRDHLSELNGSEVKSTIVLHIRGYQKSLSELNGSQTSLSELNGSGNEMNGSGNEMK